MSTLGPRIEAILSSPRPGAAPQVRTSPAFAERFRAEAERSGLDVDLEEKDTSAMVRICAVCGAQNSRFVDTCFNCQTSLSPVEAKAAAVKPRAVDSTRWLNISRVIAPLNVRVPVARERFTPYAVKPLDERAMLDRFLAVFVKRSEQHPHAPPKSIARFDQRSALDKFLSVFVQRS